MTINFTGINPIKALDWTAVLNGVIAVPLMVVMMLIAARQDIMGRFPVRGWLRGWLDRHRRHGPRRARDAGDVPLRPVAAETSESHLFSA